VEHALAVRQYLIMTVANARCAWTSPNLGGQGKNAAVFKEKMYYHKANQHDSEQVWWASAVPCIPKYYDLFTRQTFISNVQLDFTQVSVADLGGANALPFGS